VLSRVGLGAVRGRFREAAARALLLPRRRPDRRTPLWQQRQRSATLQQVATKFPAFPIVLETYRECLQDVFDLPALVELMAAIQRREVRVVEVDTPRRVAVRVVPAVRLHRVVHVRGRTRRWPSGGRRR
jgi:ATP-dependent Lhr-like helicase